MISLVLATAAAADTPGSAVTVACVMDETPQTVTPAKTRFTPGLDRHLHRGRIEPLHTCKACGWTGTVDDWTRPRSLTPAQRRAVQSLLSRSGALANEAARYRLAAEIAFASGAEPARVAHGYLMAAQVAGSRSAAHARLRRMARDHFLQAAGDDPLAAYAAAELSRQLGDRAPARVWFAVALGSAVPARLVRWSAQALAELAPAAR